jgi:hypothetical protein
MIGFEESAVSALSDGSVFAKDTLVKGKPAQIDCLRIAGQTYSIARGPLTVVRLEDEWYEDIADPVAVVKSLRENSEVRADILSYWQRLPDLEPKYKFHMEREQIAALPVKSFDHWFSHQVKSRVRTSIRKSEKEGVVVRETTFDDAFVRGMTAIFNESPTRQGTRFWHYGKDFETIKRQFSRFLHREDMIAAYYKDEMIGFIMLGNAGRFGLTGQIISSIQHRDKSTNYALIAKAVDVCERRGLGHLVYLLWTDDSLTEFKRRCGFERTLVPRYYVPLTAKGRLALKCGLHRGWRALLPRPMKASLKRLRIAWHSRQD